MTIAQFESMLRESGIDDATVKSLVANEKITARTASLKQGDEYATLEARAAALDKEATTAKSYQKWYTENYPAVLKLQQDATRYQERYGSLDDATPVNKQPVQMDEAKIQEIVTKAIADNYTQKYAPQTVGLITQVGTVVQRHITKGRKSDIDWKEIDKLAANHGGDAIKAYEEWDAPNSTKDAETAFNARVDAAVKEKMAARGLQNNFPSGADAAPSARSPLSKDDGPKAYDRNKLLETFVSGEYTGPAN